MMANPNGAGQLLAPVKNPDESPVFDYADLSWKEARQLDSIRRAITASDSDETEEKATLALYTFLAKCVVSVPRSWLVRSAPDGIDWSKPESFDFIRMDKVIDFINAVGASQSVDSVSKNSNPA